MFLGCLPSPATTESQTGHDFPPGCIEGAFHLHESLRPLRRTRRALFGFPRSPFPAEDGVTVSAFSPAQTGEIVALKKVALRRLEDGIPNQALREIKALQEIGDNQYVSETGVLRRHLGLPSSTHSQSWCPHPLCWLICFPAPHSLSCLLIHPIISFLTHSLCCPPTYFFLVLIH